MISIASTVLPTRCLNLHQPIRRFTAKDVKLPSLFPNVRGNAALRRFLPLVFAAVILAFGANSSAMAAEEVPDELVKLRTAFDKDIDFATRPIRDRYLSRLEILKRSLGSRGDARGAVAVQDEVDRILGTIGGPVTFAKFAGTWKVAYSDGHFSRYIITPDGVVKGGDFDGKAPLVTGKLLVKGNDVLLDFNNSVIERLKIVEKNLVIEHFSPRTLYPASPANFHATGTLVSIQRE